MEGGQGRKVGRSVAGKGLHGVEGGRLECFFRVSEREHRYLHIQKDYIYIYSDDNMLA